MIVGCGDLTILLVGLGFHCFLLKCKEKLRHSLGRPSRSDFVQFEVVKFRKGDDEKDLTYTIDSSTILTDRQTDGQTRAEKKGSGKHVIWIALLVLFAAPVGAPLLVALAAVLYDFTPKPTGTVEFE